MPQDGLEIYDQGYRYYTGTSDYPLNYRRAFDLFQKAADLGVSNAMVYLGIIYEEGLIVAKNDQIAVEWFSKAIQADSGNAHAAYHLGRMYCWGNGIDKNMAMAYKLCKASVDLGLGNTHSVYPQSCYLTGCILAEHYRNYKEAYPYFVDAAKYGNISAAWNYLGWLSEQGVVPLKDPGNNVTLARNSMAHDFYEKAANLGNVQAMDNLARLYCTYTMYDDAKPWLAKAASMGYEPAKQRLKMVTIHQRCT